MSAKRSLRQGWLILQLLLAACFSQAAELVCSQNGDLESPQLVKDGDVMLGGLFSFHNNWKEREETYTEKPLPLQCTSLNFREFQLAQAMLFAIEEINNSSDLLPGVSLGYKIYDTCGFNARSVKVALALLNDYENVSAPSKECGRPAQVQAIMGEASSSPSTAIISHFATCACLSDKSKYPSFLRTIPSDYYQSRALAQLVKHFGWTWVGAVRTNDDYGNSGMATFTETAQHLGICLEYSVSFFRTDPADKIQKIINTIKASTSKVIVAFLSQADMDVIIHEFSSHNLTGYQWVGTEAWIFDFQTAAGDRNHILDGAVGLSIPKAHVSGLPEFILNVEPLFSSNNDLFTEFWETLFSCEFKPSYSVEIKTRCTGQEDLTGVENTFTDMSLMPIFNNMYKGVYAVAHALLQMTLMQQKQALKLSLLTLHVCCSIDFTDSVTCVRCPLESWSNENRDACIKKEFLSYNEIMGSLLTAASLFGTCMTVAVAVIFVAHRNTPLLRANNSELSFLLLFSLKLCFLCSLTFIGQPSEWSCMLRHTAFGITFVLCISCVLGKTIVVLMAFKATLPGRNVMKWFGPTQQRVSVLGFTLIQVIICILWLSISPPFPSKNFEGFKDKIILECSLGSAVGFWAVLGYIGFLAVLCFICAFLARKLPDNFNEAKFITFSMLIFCAVWITFIPAYVSSPGKFSVAVEIFAILASSFGLLVCIFIPKCYIMLIKPEKNTKKNMMGKGALK
uniref:G-protein coupled receptors family 3 profile domain-containing protein n=1 Tax=Poecilia mexicana TaxID=48701 RepID=A0A3B3XG70_9TELE